MSKSFRLLLTFLLCLFFCCGFRFCPFVSWVAFRLFSLAQTRLVLFAGVCSTSSWTTPKVVNFIIILLLPSCTWIVSQDFSLSLNRQLDGTIQWGNLTPVRDDQTQPIGNFILLFLSLPPHPHQQWHLMEGFPPTWFWTLNQIFVHCPLPVVHAMTKSIQPLSPHSVILTTKLVTHHLQLHIQRYLTLREWRRVRPQLLFQFDQNNVRTILRTHNRRKNNARETPRSIRLQPLPFPCRLLQRSLLMDSTQKTPMKRRLFLQPTQLMMSQQSQPTLWLSLPPCQLIDPLHQLHLYCQSKSIPKRSSNQPYHSNSATHSIRSRYYYPTLDRLWRSRIDQSQEWQQIKTIVEVERCQIMSRSTSIQTSLELVEATVRPARHRNFLGTNPRPRTKDLRSVKKMLPRLALIWIRCRVCSSCLILVRQFTGFLWYLPSHYGSSI